MMVVPQYPYPVTGGLERQAHELAKALVESGISVQVVSGMMVLEQPAWELVEGVSVYRIPWSQRKWLRFLRTPFDLLHLLYARRKTYDVIHSHQHSWFGLFTILAARLLGKPILTKLPNVGEFGIPGLLARRFGRLQLALLLQSDALVAMSRQSLAELAEVGFPPGRILATPNGVRFDGVQNVAEVDCDTSAACRVAFVGRLDEQKGVDTLLLAWRDVIGLISETAGLELWGTGPSESELRQLARELDIESSVFFRGHVDEVRYRLGSMDVFVLPSRAEGNSNAILEAMAAGLPIVSTRVGGTPMLVGPCGSNLLFDVDNRDALASNLLKLIRDRALREEVGAAMRNRVERFFDIRQIARTYADAYKRLAAGQRDRVSEVSNPIIREG